MSTAEQNFASVFTPETYFKIEFNKIAGSSLSLGGRYAGEQLDLNNIYQIEVGVPPGKKFSTNRKFVMGAENDMNKGVTFAYSPNITATKYLGDLTSSQQGQVGVPTATTGNANIVIDTTVVTGSPSGYIVRKGDYIQPIADTGHGVPYRYVYQATQDVAWSSSASIVIPINRPILATTGVTNYGGLAFGNDVTFYVKYAKQNTYGVVPHDLLQYKENTLRLIEVIGL